MAGIIVLASESWNPNSVFFQWLSPAFRTAGGAVASLPAVEAVHLLGPELYRQTLLRIVAELQPQVLLTLPPLDFLDAPCSEAIQASGTRLIAWLDGSCLDWSAERLDDLRRRHDRIVTPVPALAARMPDTLLVPWTLTPESVSVRGPDVPRADVALIAPRTPEREALAMALAAKRHHIVCAGEGWAVGRVTRPQRLGLMKSARLTLTFEDQPLQLVEAALLGAPQLVRPGPMVAPYLQGEGAPATFSTAEECLERLADPSPPGPWRGAPSWPETMHRLVEGLCLSAVPPAPHRSPTLEQLQAAVAHCLEHRGLIDAARAGFSAWHALNPEAMGPLAGVARTALAVEDYASAAQAAADALARCPKPPPAVSNLMAFLPCDSAGRGLGLSGAVDSRLELVALRLKALVEGKRFFEALEEARALPVADRKAVRNAFIPSLGNSESLLMERLLSGDLPFPPTTPAMSTTSPPMSRDIARYHQAGHDRRHT